MRATPTAIIIGLVSAALLPQVLPAFQGAGYSAPLAAVIGGSLNVLSELGLAAITDFLLRFVDQMRKKTKDGKAPSEEEVREQLEKALLEQWQSGGEEAATLRQEVSKLLQAIHGIEAALSAATEEVKQALAQGLAELGGSFEEFRWILDELKDTLAEIRNKQALQLAMQKEQLGLQREQLVKTNLLLRFQQLRTSAPTPVSPVVAEDEEEIPPADVPCPYKGLAAFEPEDADYFFGREELIAELTARLAETRFLAVVGPSGSGKSSVVRAGLLPTIWRDELPGSKDWKTVILTPGEHPLEELAIRVSLLSGVAPGSLFSDLEADERGLDLAVKQALSQEAEQVRLVLIVDQFEELFTLCRDENERRRFVEALLTAVHAPDSRVNLVLAIRADFYGHCAAYPALAARLQDNQVLVGSLSENELRQAIERPATQVGLNLEPGLVETILHDVADAPGALPLLSHALLETWNRRRGYTLTLDGYTETGGVQGAIARTADQVFDEQLSPDQQVIARNIFLRLTSIGEGAQDTRRRAKRDELIPRPEEEPAVEAVLKTLIETRLLTTSEDTVEVAHEALIHQWPKLRRWLEEDIEGLRIHRHLTEIADEWAELERDSGALYRGARLATASEWAGDHIDQLNPLERAFLEASQALEVNELEAERKRSYQLRIRAFYLAGALVVALVMASVAIFLGRQARMSATEAEENASQAQAASTLAVMQQATAESERIRADLQARFALSRQLAAQALSYKDEKYDLALLLSIQAYREKETFSARDSLLTELVDHPQLKAVMRKHMGSIQSVVFSPDGTTLASGSRDGNVILWDLKTRQPLGEPLSGHTDSVWSVAFNPDGSILASASYDDTIILWDLETQQPLGAPLSGHTDAVESVAFSPDGSILASGSWDGTIILWDLETRQPLGSPLSRHTGAVSSVAFSPDGSMLASGGTDGTIILWDIYLEIAHAKLGDILSGPMNPVWSVSFSSDGLMLAAGTKDGTIYLWDMVTHQLLGSPLDGHSNFVQSVVFSPDASILASGSWDGNVILWDLETLQPLGEPFYGDKDFVWSVAFSPDGSILASGGDDRAVKLWDLETRQPLGEPLTDPHLNSRVAISQDGTTLASSGCSCGTITLWDMQSRRPLGAPLSGHTGSVVSVAFSPDGKTLASGSHDGSVILWDLETHQSLGKLFTDDTDFVFSVTFSPDGLTLASGSDDGFIILWDVESLQPLGTPLSGHTGSVVSVAFSPDGTTLASGSHDGTVILWDLESGQPLGEPLPDHKLFVWSVAFSPDGNMLASGGSDGIVIWDLEARQLFGEHICYTDFISSVAFSPDGITLASGSDDGTVILWDLETRLQLGEPLSSHMGTVWSMAFSPDSSMLASGSDDGTVIIWDVNTESWVDRACRIANRNLTQEEWERYLGDEIYQETCPDIP